ncbi:MAG: signal-transducing histidine kinase [Candidatus Peregrinibacteria bacterium Greene0416_62]|nr:MAG: signal-transducing histidine kinase [Candidatus Peregrinibacteria bacterium Greene0416_62]
MSLPNDIPPDRFNELLAQVPIVEENLRELMSLKPVDFSAVEEKTCVLIDTADRLQHLTWQLREQSSLFRSIFGHDVSGVFSNLGSTLDDIRHQASSLFDKISFDKILNEIGVKENEGARMEVGFVDELKKMARDYCLIEQIAVDNDSDDDAGVPLQLREKAARIAIEPYQLSHLREEVLDRGIGEFDTLFLEYFGGSCVDVDFEGLRQRVRTYCMDQSEAPEEISDTDNNVLRSICIAERDVNCWRAEVHKHAAEILDLRSQVWISLWTALRTIESIGYWVSGHIIEPEARSIQQFLADATPALKSVFSRKSRKSPLDCEGDADAVVSMHQGTVAAILSNIVANAGKHGKSTALHITSLVQEHSVQLIVEDNGSGFPVEVAERIYEPGFSGGESSGLGLADADKRMAITGGSLHADGHGGLINKTNGNGAKFTLTLPRVDVLNSAH